MNGGEVLFYGGGVSQIVGVVLIQFRSWEVRLAGMALKAVNVHRCVGVTGLTEVFWSLKSGVLSLVIGDNMAADTAHQRVLRGTNAPVHGVIALVF